MAWSRIAAIAEKEVHEALRNRYVLMLLITLPIAFAALPVVSLLSIRGLPASPPSETSRGLPPALARRLAGLSPREQLEVFLTSQFMPILWIAPLALPMTIATYSVVGEKREKALEPLLATPITTVELLAGKALAAAAPGIALSGLTYLLMVGAAGIIGLSAPAFRVLWGPTAWLQVLGISPLLTLLATLLGLSVSSRVNDPRLAEQIGMIVVLPLLGLIIAQSMGVLWLSGTLLLGVALFLLTADGLLLALAVALFERETILTRWR
ncbi:ABC transporter permease [Thermoflexus hugenholtzii]